MGDLAFYGEWMKDDVLYLKEITPEIISEIRSFEMTKKDVLVASYPKTGSISSDDSITLVHNNG
jgi:hypothetical protein